MHMPFNDIGIFIIQGYKELKKNLYFDIDRSCEKNKR